MRGVPIRLELGNRDLEAGVATLVRRDKAVKEEGQKQQVPLAEVVAFIPTVLEQIQHACSRRRGRSCRTTRSRRSTARSSSACSTSAPGWSTCRGAGGPECEAAVKEATRATTRNLREPARAETCVPCGEPARYQAYFAQSY